MGDFILFLTDLQKEQKIGRCRFLDLYWILIGGYWISEQTSMPIWFSEEGTLLTLLITPPAILEVEPRM